MNWRKNLHDAWYFGTVVWVANILLPYFPKHPKTYWPFWPFNPDAVLEIAIELALPPLAIYGLGAALLWFSGYFQRGEVERDTPRKTKTVKQKHGRKI